MRDNLKTTKRDRILIFNTFIITIKITKHCTKQMRRQRSNVVFLFEELQLFI